MAKTEYKSKPFSFKPKVIEIHMCGIAGFFCPDTLYSDAHLTEIAVKMGNAIAYRGPDSHSSWVKGQQGIGLSHRRLAIVDLSEAGHQPMISHCGRYIIVYNGEIYNSEQIRADMRDYDISYRGYSDTEVILEGCAKLGVQRTVEKMVGMFAFALWDMQEKTLYLVRDRLGIKPLYWAEFGKNYLFGSELKALMAHPLCHKNINSDALFSYLRHSYIPGPASIYQNVHKLEPGHILKICQGKTPEAICYWSLKQVMTEANQNPYQGTTQQAIQDLEDLLKTCVGCRMIADVPFGAFLSGGIDSSLVTALMQAQSTTPIQSFSIGFQDQSYNEAPYAASIAAHLGTHHTELYVTPKDVQSVIPNLAHMYDEPFADSSQLPTWLVSHMTRQHVTVALSGDGGDEVFGGYNRYITAQKHAQSLFQQPRFLRQMESYLLKSLSSSQWDKLAHLIPAKSRPSHFGDKIGKLANILTGDIDQFYLKLVSHWDEPQKIARQGTELQTALQDKTLETQIPNFVQRMQYLDMLTYLPDDILTKVDRASMSVSLEARVPLLDHRLIEFACSLPQEMKIQNGSGKWVLRQVLYKHVPQSLIDRPKMGFSLPIGEWLQGPLRDWADSLLSETSLKKHDFVDSKIVRQYWQEHLSGKRNWQYQLWNILMLQSWAHKWH